MGPRVLGPWAPQPRVLGPWALGPRVPGPRASRPNVRGPRAPGPRVLRLGLRRPGSDRVIKLRFGWLAVGIGDSVASVEFPVVALALLRL